MKKKRCPRGLWLIALGALMIAAALWGLMRQPSILQYSIVAPMEATDETDAPSRLMELARSWDKRAREELADVLFDASIAARDYGFSAGGATATLTAVGENWFSVYPKYLTAGRLMERAELKDGARVTVLDEELAFKLFPTSDPLEGKVQVGDSWYRVIGTVRRARGVGDYDRWALYIPLAHASGEGLQFDTVEVSGIPIPRSGASLAFEEAAENWSPEGTFADLDKEVMRAGIILRALAILFGFFALLALLRRLNARFIACAGVYRRRLNTEYFRGMLSEVLARSLLFALGYAAIIGGGYALLSLAIDPMYVFTEWIPDVLVELSSIGERFWQLARAAATPISVRTQEFSEIRFWAGILRWGAIALLSGLCVMRGARNPNAGGLDS